MKVKSKSLRQRWWPRRAGITTGCLLYIIISLSVLCARLWDRSCLEPPVAGTTEGPFHFSTLVIPAFNKSESNITSSRYPAALALTSGRAKIGGERQDAIMPRWHSSLTNISCKCCELLKELIFHATHTHTHSGSLGRRGGGWNLISPRASGTLRRQPNERES